MAADGPLAAFFGAVEVAWKVYDLGWAQNQYSRPEFADFGSEIQSLAQNLSNTVRVVENARLQYQQHAIRSPRFCGFSSQKNWDLSSLHEIIGPFRDTLSQCEMMVARTLRGDLTNHETIQTAEEIAIIHFKLDELQKSVRAHNHKISVLLKPLEIKLFSDIQLEFGVQVPPNRHVQVIPYVPMQALLVAGIEQALVEYWQPRPVPLIVPDELESKLQSSIEHQYKPELRMSSGMFLHTALENFLTCFEQSTRSFTGSSFLKDRTPSAKQYINLLRCFLILKQLQESDELKWVDQSSLWPAFVVELWDQVRMECHRFDASSQQQLIVPNLASLRSELERGVQTRSKKEEILNLMSPLQDTDMEEVFRVPLPSPQESLKRHLTVSRMEPTKLRLVESVANESDPANPLGEISMDIDLRTIQLIPLYAIPSSRPRLFEVLLHTGSSQLNPSFMEHKQVLRLQHLLTGYKVHQRYDQAMVRISFFITGRSEPLEEQGRIQLWLPQPFTPVNKVLSSKASISARSERPDTQVVIPSKPLAQTETSRSRAGSIRQLISGLRLGSDRTKALSNGHNKRSNSTTGSSNYSSSPVASPATSSQGPTLGHNNSKTVHEIGGEFAGPFELPSENSAAFYQNTSFRGLNANTAWVPPATNLNTLPISSHYMAPSRNYTAGWTRSNGPAPSPNDVQPVSPTNYLSVDSHNSPPGLHGQAYAAAGSGNIYPGLYGQPYAPTRSDSSSPGLHPGLQPHTTTRSDTSSPYYQPSSNIHADTSSPTNLTTQSNTSPPLHPNFAIPHLTTNAAPPIARKALPHRLPPVQSVFTYQRPSVPTNQYATSASPPHLPPFQPQPATHSDHVPATPSRPTRASPSVVSNMSVCSCSSLAPTVSTIRTSTSNSSSTSSGIARLHRKPQKPLLVMFLKGRDASARLSIVAVEIDHNTAVKRERCECYNSHSSCRVSCVEQERGGTLRAQRWDAEDLAAWDVAKVGEWQRKEGEKVWPNLRRVSMKFEKMEDRYKFAGSPCSCNVRTTHELSRCNLESHNGLFGIVKQVGDEMLRKYHSEQDQASSRTIQLGPVPEGDF